VGAELVEVLTEGVAVVAAQGTADGRGEAQGPTDAEIDPTGLERGEHADLLGDDDRLVVRQHHSAGSHPDPIGGGGDGRHQHGRRARADAGNGVVFGYPEAVVTQSLGSSRAVQSADDGGGVRFA
jgi:hypothetical protein